MASFHQRAPAQPGCHWHQPFRQCPQPLEVLSQIIVSLQLCKWIILTIIDVIAVCLSVALTTVMPVWCPTKEKMDCILWLFSYMLVGKVSISKNYFKWFLGLKVMLLDTWSLRCCYCTVNLTQQVQRAHSYLLFVKVYNSFDLWSLCVSLFIVCIQWWNVAN